MAAAMLKHCASDLKKKFYDRYDVNELMHKAHLTPEQIAEDAIAHFEIIFIYDYSP